MTDAQPGRRRRNAGARTELATARSKAMPARHRQRLANLAASAAAQPQLEHLDRLKATAMAMTATNDHAEENAVSTDTEWTTMDFRPAPAGWRLAYLVGGKVSVVPMPGWLVQDGYRKGNGNRTTVNRRIVAAEVDTAGEHAALIEAIEPWRVLAPSEPDPTAEDAAAEARRAS